MTAARPGGYGVGIPLCLLTGAMAPCVTLLSGEAGNRIVRVHLLDLRASGEVAHLDDIERNHEAYAGSRTIVASSAVKKLARPVRDLVPAEG